MEGPPCEASGPHLAGPACGRIPAVEYLSEAYVLDLVSSRGRPASPPRAIGAGDREAMEGPATGPITESRAGALLRQHDRKNPSIAEDEKNEPGVCSPQLRSKPIG